MYWTWVGLVSFSLGAIVHTASAQNRDTASIIKQRMREVATFAGSWRATTAFHNREGQAPEYREAGTYEISWILDSTYLRWDISLHGPLTGQERSMVIMMTYNPDSLRYEVTYFYSGSPLRVFEAGEYDTTRKEFRTRAFIPREDGIRDENVRTISRITTANDILYEHYSRYSDEGAERNDFTAVLHRVR